LASGQQSGRLALFVLLSTLFVWPTQSPNSGDAKEKTLSGHATGAFDVKISPLTLSEQSADPKLGRMSIEKQYHGELEATAKGEMLTAESELNDSGVYVAVERVTGTLHGKKGSFAMHHTGVMNRGKPELKISVVPDSGKDDLQGLTGTMNIRIESGKHFYDFDYSLPAK
jgi:hypothetical protein